MQLLGPGVIPYTAFKACGAENPFRFPAFLAAAFYPVTRYLFYIWTKIFI
jgi:hypothetical protein